jgi:hypothetical protein
MIPDGKGRFCGHCRKTVEDFTAMSDAALLAYISRYGLGCGRFRKDQLDREISLPVTSHRKWWPGLLVSMGLLLGTRNESSGQERISPPVQSRRIENATEPVGSPLENAPDSTGICCRIKGDIKDDEDKGLPLAKVRIIGSDYATFADSNGHYELDIPDRYRHKPFTLLFTYTGSEATVDISLTGQKELYVRAEILHREYVTMGGAISYTTARHLNRWQSLKYRVLRRLHLR